MMIVAEETLRACMGSAGKASDTSSGGSDFAVLRRDPPQCAGVGTFGVHVRSWARERAGMAGKEEVDMSRTGWVYRLSGSRSTRRYNGRVVPRPPIVQCQHAHMITNVRAFKLCSEAEDLECPSSSRLAFFLADSCISS